MKKLFKIKWVKIPESNKILSLKGIRNLMLVILIVTLTFSYFTEYQIGESAGNGSKLGGNKEVEKVAYDVTTNVADQDQSLKEDQEEEVQILISRFIHEHIWFFESPEDEYPVGRVNNQLIHVIEEDGDWLKVYTKEGIRWANPRIVPSTDHLDELLYSFGNLMAVHFENMETGFTYQHHSEEIFTSASVPKATYALYLFKQAEEGLVDIESLPFPWGDETIRELLRRNVSESCDNSTMTLINLFGIEGYREFIGEIGGNTGLVGCRVMNSDLTAREAGIFARAIFEYIDSEGRYGHLFKKDLLDNQYPFIVSDYPVASKSGWYTPHAWHDMAVIYAPSPFTLVILSSRGGWTEQDYADFYKVSMAFQEFNNKWFF